MAEITKYRAVISPCCGAADGASGTVSTKCCWMMYGSDLPFCFCWSCFIGDSSSRY